MELRTTPTKEEREEFGLNPEQELFTHYHFHLYKKWLQKEVKRLDGLVKAHADKPERQRYEEEQLRTLRYVEEALYDIWFGRNSYKYRG